MCQDPHALEERWSPRGSKLAHRALATHAGSSSEGHLFDSEIPVEVFHTVCCSGMLQEYLSKEMLTEAVTKASGTSFELREGVTDLLDLLQEHHVDFQIFSAGIGDVIDAALAVLYPKPIESSTVVVSNRMLWTNEGSLVGFSSPLIHMYNKSQTAVDNSVLKNALLIGDSLGDATMADGATRGPDVAVKIGFLNAGDPDEAAVEQYKAKFDIVILNDKDASLNVLLSICAAVLWNQGPLTPSPSPTNKRRRAEAS